MALAASGTFTELITLAVVLILLIDGLTVASLFRLRARRPAPGAPFLTPLYPFVPALFIAVYLALFYGTLRAQPSVVVKAVAVLLVTWGFSWLAISRADRESHSPSPV